MDQPSKPLPKLRILLIALVAVVVVLGAAFIVLVIGNAGTKVNLAHVDALAESQDACVVCHREATPGIIEQFGHSAMAAAEVTCRKCHEGTADYPAAVLHEGSYILATPTTARCAQCHQTEAAEFTLSRHSLPAYVAFAGSKELPSTLMAMYQAVPEGSFAPDKTPNAIYTIEGKVVTPFTCERCHNIGVPAADNSIGQCQKCHLRHEFSLAQARMPETCNNCHIGPDHPQWEIYQESAHGIQYVTLGSGWNWTAQTGNLTASDFTAPTCALCHMSGFGATGTTHDVGDRLSWFLFASISQQRPGWQENRDRMQSVCFECHNKNFVTAQYASADAATQLVNDWVQQSVDLMAPLQKQGLLTSQPYDEPIDFTSYNLWHYYGRTAKFGLWMQGADYSQWHGAYPLMETMADLQELVTAKLQAAGATP